MSSYSTSDKVFMVKNFYINESSLSRALSAWSSQFKNRAKPSNSTVLNWIKNFETHGNVEAPRSGPAVTVRTEENIARADEIVKENPNISVAQLAQRLGVSKKTANVILKKDLNLFAYKIQLLQHFPPNTEVKRLAFANKIADMIDNDEIDPRKIWFTDEAHFYLDGYINRQNYRIWGSENPQMFRVKPLHPQKVTAWIGISYDGYCGPYFFDETINSERYVELLKNKVIPAIAGENMLNDHWFMQDGAPPHRTRDVHDVLSKAFDNRVISLDFPGRHNGQGIEWPPYSPDLNPLDFFLWGALKDNIYRNSNPPDVSNLKGRIMKLMREMPDLYRHRAIDNFELRIRHVILADGEHFENLIR